MPDFLPRREADLSLWLARFDEKVVAAPGEYGLTQEEAADYHARYDLFAVAYRLASDPTTRTPSSLFAKDRALSAVLAAARRLGRTVRGSSAVTDAQRLDLGLSPRPRKPSPIGPPATAPRLTVTPLLGRTAVRVRLWDPASPTRTARPKGAAGATLFTHVGEAEPDGSTHWEYCRNATRTTVDVEVTGDVPVGARVWVKAFWFSPTRARSPASEAVAARVVGGWAKAA